MKVDGNAFKRAREKIRARSPGRGTAGQPARGTQEWLANEAQIAVRLVKNLEKSEASEKTLRKVSEVLGIQNWEEYILDYGSEYVICQANNHIDFRPERYPEDYPDDFMHSVMVMTIDPLSILAEPGKFDSFILNKVKAQLTRLNQEIPFIWFAEVSLTPDSQSWLGWMKAVDSFEIAANNKKISRPIMFKQHNSYRVSWMEFVKMVETSEKANFCVEVELEFARFTQKIDIYICINCLKSLFRQGRKKYQSEWPHRAQLSTISPD